MKKLLVLLAATSIFTMNCDQVTSIGSDTDATKGSATAGFIPPATVVTKINSSNQCQIRETRDENWKMANVPGNAIAVEGGFDPNNSPFTTKPAFVINDDGTVYKTNSASSPWYQVFGMDNGVDIGSNGKLRESATTYAINESGNVHKLDENGMFQWHSRLSAQGIDAQAVRIDVDGDGNPWVVGSDGKVYTYENDAWVMKLESSKLAAKDIGCANGKVYITVVGNALAFGALYEYDRTSGAIANMNMAVLKVDAESTKVYGIDYRGVISILNTLDGTITEDIAAGDGNLDIGL